MASFLVYSTFKYPLLSIFILINVILFTQSFYIPDFISTHLEQCQLVLEPSRHSQQQRAATSLLRMQTDNASHFGTHHLVNQHVEYSEWNGIIKERSLTQLQNNSTTTFQIILKWNSKAERRFCPDEGCSLDTSRSIIQDDLNSDWDTKEISCRVNYVRHSIQTVHEFQSTLISYLIMTGIGIVASIVVTLGIMSIIWFFWWNQNSFSALFIRREWHSLRWIPKWVLRDRVWKNKLQHARWFTMIFYSWCWFLFEGAGRWKSSLHNNFRLFIDEDNPLVVLPSYRPFVSSLRLTALQIREQLLAFERLDIRKRLLSKQEMLPLCISLGATGMCILLMLLSLLFKWNIFFALMIYTGELICIFICCIVQLGTHHLIVTDQRIGIVHYFPIRGCVLISHWMHELDAFYYNRTNGDIILFKKPAFEARAKAPTRNRQSFAAWLLPWRSRWSKLEEEESPNQVTHQEQLRQEVMPNHERIILPLGMNEAVVVRDALVAHQCLQEIQSLQEQEQEDSSEDYDTSSIHQEDHILDSFL